MLGLHCGGGGGTSPRADAAALAGAASCVPGASLACTGADGCAGFQVCAPSGTTYKPCVCGSSLPTDAVASETGSSSLDAEASDGSDATPGDAVNDTGDATQADS